MSEAEVRISYEEMQNTLYRVLTKHGFASGKAQRLATVISQSTLDGINSHGIERFPELIDMADRGIVQRDAEPSLVSGKGAFERWDGNHGAGIWNAWQSMERAIALAKSNVLGAVALRNTNHWLRGGTYGWQAADAGCIAICFSNTQPNMPPWGGKDSRTGNNPLVIAMPDSGGHIVLDMSMAQFSYGKIKSYAAKNEKLPFPGGWDDAGELTDDPAIIFRNLRPLPIGYWKGSALSIMLDLLVTVLSEGNSTYRIGRQQTEQGWKSSVAPGQKILESDLSQVFIVIDAAQAGDTGLQEALIKEIIDNIHHVDPVKQGQRTYVPGENTLAGRKENLARGIPVDAETWNKVNAL